MKITLLLSELSCGQYVLNAVTLSDAKFTVEEWYQGMLFVMSAMFVERC